MDFVLTKLVLNIENYLQDGRELLKLLTLNKRKILIFEIIINKLLSICKTGKLCIKLFLNEAYEIRSVHLGLTKSSK